MKNYAIADKLIAKVFEDDDMLIVAKPAGVDVGGATGKPRASRGRDTGGLLEILNHVRDEDGTLEPVNRLSRFESGLLILGKNAGMVRTLRNELRAGRIKQEYQAIVLGKMKKLHVTIRPGRVEEEKKPKGRPRPVPSRSRQATQRNKWWWLERVAHH